MGPVAVQLALEASTYAQPLRDTPKCIINANAEQKRNERSAVPHLYTDADRADSPEYRRAGEASHTAHWTASPTRDTLHSIMHT
jgi:hypothetical protein